MEQGPLIALASPPAISDRFVQGLSLSKALAHPALGPALGSEDDDAR
jgi:hypothetical protein